jgi:hypothetical protein
MYASAPMIFQTAKIILGCGSMYPVKSDVLSTYMGQIQILTAGNIDIPWYKD